MRAWGIRGHGRTMAGHWCLYGENGRNMRGSIETYVGKLGSNARALRHHRVIGGYKGSQGGHGESTGCAKKHGRRSLGCGWQPKPHCT